DPNFDMTTPPLEQVNKMTGSEFFRYAAELLQLHPPHPTDWSTLARIKRIGLERGKSFVFENLEPATRQALDRVPSDALGLMRERAPTLAKVVNGWMMDTNWGVYGNFYLERAIVAMAGLGANQ